MATLRSWIEHLRGAEPVEACVFGYVGGHEPYEQDDPDPNKDLLGRVLSYAEAAPIIDCEFHSGYGSPQAHTMAIYTRNWIISTYQYDGATGAFRLPRNPTATMDISMPGGG